MTVKLNNNDLCFFLMAKCPMFMKKERKASNVLGIQENKCPLVKIIYNYSL